MNASRTGSSISQSVTRRTNPPALRHGGIVESILPEVKTLTEAEQYELMEHILHLPDAQKMTAKVFADHARKVRKAVDAVGAVSPEC